MARVTAPVEGFSGRVVGVAFTDGQGETDDVAALAYFHRHGYTVTGEPEPRAFPEGDPSEDWKGDQIKAYAEAHGIDLGGATKKADMVAVIAAATEGDGETTPES